MVHAVVPSTEAEGYGTSVGYMHRNFQASLEYEGMSKMEEYCLDQNLEE